MSSSCFNLSQSSLYRLSTAGYLIAALVLTGCQSSTENNAAISGGQNNNNATPVTSDTSQKTMTQQALRIQRALANNDYTRIIKDIHPIRGIRFSMYAYVRPELDKVFSRAQFAQYLQKPKIRFTWGAQDGTGDRLITPLPDYLRTWVNASIFTNNSVMTVNGSQATGNSINNLNKIYQKSDYVEFYYSGSENYGGMDWQAMRLVFDNYQGQRYLVAIISDRWTI